MHPTLTPAVKNNRSLWWVYCVSLFRSLESQEIEIITSASSLMLRLVPPRRRRYPVLPGTQTLQNAPARCCIKKYRAVIGSETISKNRLVVIFPDRSNELPAQMANGNGAILRKQSGDRRRKDCKKNPHSSYSCGNNYGATRIYT